MVESASTSTPPTAPSSSAVNGHVGAGFITKGPYKGLHWTQTPTGKKKARLNAIKSAATRMRNKRAKLKAADLKPATVKWQGRGKVRYAPGTHWTQTPEGKRKMSAAMKAVHAAKGHAVGGVATKATSDTTRYAKGKRDVIALAVIGAKQQLAWHLAQASKLKIFLSVNAKRVELGNAE